MRFEIDFHDNGSLIWTWPLTLIVGLVGLVLVGLGVLLPAWSDPVGLAGAVALFVAAAGRSGSALELRYAEAPLAQPPSVAHHARARRRSMRRSSGAPLVTAGLGGCLLVAASIGGPVDLRLVLAAGGLALVGFGVLAGPVAGFVVTPRHLHIDTALRRTSVPRRLIGTFEHSDLEVRLRLRDGDFVDIRVDSPIMEYSARGYWMNARCRVRTVERIVRMLREVPEAPGADATVTHVLRRPVIVGAASAALVVVAAGVVTAYLGA